MALPGKQLYGYSLIPPLLPSKASARSIQEPLDLLISYYGFMVQLYAYVYYLHCIYIYSRTIL